MKHYMMRAGKSPLDNFTAYETLMRDTIGGNSGNMLFADSCFRALYVKEKTIVDVNYYKYDKKKADEINEKYDAYIIPLANAFRPGFKEFDRLIEFIRCLKIPCIVVGVGGAV